MHKFVDLTGLRFGERVVISLSYQAPKSGNYYWKVRCSCGREDVVSGSRLKRGTKCLECSGRINGRKGLDSKSKGLPCYFIRCGEYLKVGSSKDPERRFRDMQTDNPYPMELLFVDYENGEKFWHDRLSDCRYKGEWFYFHKACEIVDLT